MLILGFLSSLTLHLLLFSYSQLKEAIQLEMHLSYAEVGLIFSISVLALILFRIPWGLVIDRMGLKVSLGTGLTLMGVSGLLRGFASDYAVLLLFQLLLGIGFAAIMPSMSKIASAWFPPRKAGFAIGVAISGFAVGDIIGLSVTPYLLTWLGGWRNVFLVYGLWAVLLAVAWWVLAKENESHDSPTETKLTSSSSITKNFTALLRVKQVWLFTGLYFCASVCYDTFLLWLPSILDAEGVQSTTAGLITSMLPLGFIFACFVVGSLSDRVGLRKPFILVLGLVSGPVVYAAGTLQGLGVWFFAFVLGVCSIGVLTLVIAMPVEHKQTAVFVGSAVGLISSFGNLGSFFMPTVMGFVKDVTGSFLWAVLILAVFGELMLILGLPLTETGRKKLKQSAVACSSTSDRTPPQYTGR
jgi:nitrate/nitrite transporter NarK